MAETRGNPLALLELPRGLSATELAGDSDAAASPLPGTVEESFRRRLDALPDDARRLLLVAAADPLGEPALVWRAAELLGIAPQRRSPAEAGLCEFGARVRFRHPLVRTAAYGAASSDERRRAHAAIAEATDAATDPDRRAWHRALASAGPDDAVADELERSAGRARARGGQAAAAAFLERSMDLTIDPAAPRRARAGGRRGEHLAGSAEDALAARGAGGARARSTSSTASASTCCGAAWRRCSAAHATRRRSCSTRRGGSSASTAASARRPTATRSSPPSTRGASRVTPGCPEVAAAVRSAPPSADPPSATDELLDAAALLVDAGWARRARTGRSGRWPRSAPRRTRARTNLHWRFLAARMLAPSLGRRPLGHPQRAELERVRDAGVLALLPMAAALRVGWELFAGDLDAASAHVVEQDTVHEAIGGDLVPRVAGRARRPPRARGRAGAARRGQRRATPSPAAMARGRPAPLVEARSCNGLGRYDEALAAAEAAAASGPTATFDWALREVVEAAARCGRRGAARTRSPARRDDTGRVARTGRSVVDARARARS